MTNEPHDTTLADYTRVLRQRRFFIVIVALVCAAAALGFSATQSKKYEATASLSIRDVNSDLSLLGAGGYSAQTPLQLASAHKPQVTRPEVVDGVQRQLGNTLTASQIQDAVTLTVNPNSFLIEITAHSGKARDAAAIANAVARQDARLSTIESRKSFKVAAAKLNSRLAKLKSAKDDTTKAFYIAQLSRLQSLSAVAQPVALSELAQIPGSPTSPKPLRNTIIALIFGLFLGIALAYARSAFDRRLRQPADINEYLPFPVVGRIRSDALGHIGAGLTRPGAKSRKRKAMTEVDQESFRILRHNVRYLSIDDDIKTVLITSAMAQEGKSTVSSCLAMAHAGAGRRTLLIECDLRRPVLAERLGVAPTPGLTDYLTGHAKPQEIVRAVSAGQSADGNGGAPGTLAVIPAGSLPPRPSDLLSSKRFAEFLREVSEVYETVIIDSAPLLTVADTLEVIPSVDAVLLCVRLQQATRDQVLSGLDILQRLPEKPTGVVLTDVPETGDDYYTYYASDRAKARA